MSFYGARDRFRLNSPSGYNIPRPKSLFFVNFVSRFLDPQFLQQTSYYVKTADRIQMTYNVQEANQYNKKRLIQTKVNYGTFNFTMYDVIAAYGLKLVESYNRFYYGDFENKDNNSWNYDVTTNNFEQVPNWGLKANQIPSNGFFFDRIEFYEFYDQTYNQINFINPKFTDVAFSPTDMLLMDGQEISISCKYEGMVIEAIAQPITVQLSNMFGVTLHSDFGLPAGALAIPGVQSLINYGTNVVTNILTGLGLGSFASGNLANALTQQTLSSLGPKLNTGVGKVIFSNINSTSNSLASVNSRVASGDIVRDISTGTTIPSITSLFI